MSTSRPHIHPSRRRWSSHSARAVLGALVVFVVLAVAAPAAQSYPGAPWFEPGATYTANFPDPSILVHEGRYYAYGTATGGAYLPVMVSDDLQTWTARPAYDPGPPENADPYFNDALPRPASWGASRPTDGRMDKEVWAPGVARIGDRFAAFYTVRTSLSADRFCISVATSSSPLGPFVDRSTGPLVCDADPNGSTDPFPFVEPATGVAHLLWKSEGVPGSTPTRIWSRQLDADGTGFAPGSTRRLLLETSQGWEGNVIENPAMVRHEGDLHLFYSANEWRSADYAIGHATCTSPTGGCQKRGGGAPLLASRGDRWGPGGPAPFVDLSGRLRLGYHAWNAPYADYPSYPACTSNGSCTSQGQRRLHVGYVHGQGGDIGVGSTDTFSDVPAGAFYVDAVRWLKERGITTGLGDSHRFGPSAHVTRGQTAAFLWRMEDRPVPHVGHRFVDVASGAYYAEPIRWLDQEGITAGRAGGQRFAPDARVSRAEMATFLWRLAGEPTPSGGPRFADVPEGEYYDLPVRWLAQEGITTGVAGSTRFAPGAPVTRGQMAAFLQRFDRRR